MNISRYQSEIIGAILCIALGMLSGAGVKPEVWQWFANLKKPELNPPGFIFGPVWTVLYTLIGIAGGRLWRSGNKLLLTIFTAQLIFNFTFTTLFFRWQRLDLALVDIALLWLSILLFMIASFKDKLLFFLFTPYFAWVSFAFHLNLEFYLLNIALL